MKAMNQYQKKITIIFFFISLFTFLPILGYSQFFNRFNEQPIDVDIHFLKHSLESSAKKTFFNVLKIKNKANRSESMTLNLSVPEGWRIIGDTKQEITLNPFDSIPIPIMVSVGEKARGDIGYSIIASLSDIRGNTVKNEYCFVKIPRETELNVKVLDRSAYIDLRTRLSSFSVKVENKGNREELVNFIFETDPGLGIGPAKQNHYSSEVVMSPYSDSTLTFEVILNDAMMDETKNMYKLKLITSTIDTTYSSSIWFNKLSSYYNNYISQTSKPLVFEFVTMGLLQSENKPSWASRAEGIILLKKNNDIYYYYRNFNSEKKEELYKLNRMYIGTHIKKWNIEVGDSYNSLESNLSGRGGFLAFNSKRIKFELTTNRNVLTHTLNVGTLFKYNFSDNLSVNSGVAYNQNSKINITSKLALLGSEFTIRKKHHFYIMGAYNLLEQPINYINQHNEFGGEFKYNSSIGKVKTSIRAKYGSNLYYGNYRGRFTLSYQSYYNVTLRGRLSIVGYENWYGVPQIINETSVIGRDIKARDISTDYSYILNEKVILNGGIGYEESYWKGISEVIDRSFFHTNANKIQIGTRFKIDEKNTFITPQVTLAKVNVIDYPNEALTTVPNILYRKNFSYQNFAINLHSKIWGVLGSLTSGPKSLFEQYSYFFNERNNRRLRIMPYLDVFLYKNQLHLITNVSFSNDLIAKTSYTNITSQLFWNLPKDWQINILSAYSLQKRIDVKEASQTYQTIYLEAGIIKEFNLSHPRIKYLDLQLVFFKDFNGNSIQDPNEPGIKNVLVNLARQFSPELGDIPGDITTVELLSDINGMVRYDKIPSGIYTINYNPVGKEAGTFSKAISDLEMNLDKSKTLYLPFVEKNKVFGKIILSRSRLSGLGRVDVSNVRITATDSKGRTYSSLTNKNGEFVIFAPITDQYVVNINNIFYENFDLRQNNFKVQFNGYKQFEVNFVFDEKIRRVNFSPSSQDAQLANILQVRRTNLKGTIKDESSLSPIRARVNLINTKTNTILTSMYSSSQTGDYNISFMADENYLLEILADGYWYHSENLNLNQVTTFLNVTKDVMLKPIAIGSKIELNIKFEINKVDLAPESVAELNRLIKLLKDNGNIKVEVQGHADDLEALNNPQISEDRAKRVARYLIENGFSNIQIRGFGNTVPIASNDTEEGRATNRRVEIEVVSK